MIYDIKIPAGSAPFGEWLVKTMAKRDMTIDDLAMRLDVKSPTVRQWCRDPQNLKIKRLRSIIDELVDDPIIWWPHFNKAIQLIINNKQNNQYKNRRLSK
jgi:transcriptional regulator with XRE-family HTH domain